MMEVMMSLLDLACSFGALVASGFAILALIKRDQLSTIEFICLAGFLTLLART